MSYASLMGTAACVPTSHAVRARRRGPWAWSSRRSVKPPPTRRADMEQVFRAAACVNATTRQTAVSASTAAEELHRAAVEADADLIVSGASGDSRMREWFLGGVTRDLLAEAPVCCLTSH